MPFGNRASNGQSLARLLLYFQIAFAFSFSLPYFLSPTIPSLNGRFLWCFAHDNISHSRTSGNQCISFKLIGLVGDCRSDMQLSFVIAVEALVMQ